MPNAQSPIPNAQCPILSCSTFNLLPLGRAFRPTPQELGLIRLCNLDVFQLTQIFSSLLIYLPSVRLAPYQRDYHPYPSLQFAYFAIQNNLLRRESDLNG